MPEFQRTSIRLPAGRYLGRQFYFVTLCFHRRRHYGANTRIANWLIRKLRQHAAACNFFCHAHCVMPHHLHVLVAGAKETSDMLKFVMKFKQDTAQPFAAKTDQALWQFKFYDHILRSRGPRRVVHLVKPCSSRDLRHAGRLSIPWIVH